MPDLPPFDVPVRAGNCFIIRRVTPDDSAWYEDAIVPELWSYAHPATWEDASCLVCKGAGYHVTPGEPVARRALLERMSVRGVRGIPWCSACARTGVATG